LIFFSANHGQFLYCEVFELIDQISSTYNYLQGYGASARLVAGARPDRR